MTKCLYCDREFTPRTTWQKFCKTAHRVAYFIRMKKQQGQGQDKQQKAA